MTRVLVALEMYSCNGLGLMDFTVPPLVQVSLPRDSRRSLSNPHPGKMRKLRLGILPEAVRTQTHIHIGTAVPTVSLQLPSLKAHMSGLCMAPSFILV